MVRHFRDSDMRTDLHKQSSSLGVDLKRRGIRVGMRVRMVW